MRVRLGASGLISGHGAPVPAAVVVTDGPAIVYAGPAADAPETPDATVVRAATVMPGLWDCHVHLVGAMSLNLALGVFDPPELAAVRSAADLRAALDAGVTSV